LFSTSCSSFRPREKSLNFHLVVFLIRSKELLWFKWGRKIIAWIEPLFWYIWIVLEIIIIHFLENDHFYIILVRFKHGLLLECYDLLLPIREEKSLWRILLYTCMKEKMFILAFIYVLFFTYLYFYLPSIFCYV